MPDELDRFRVTPALAGRALAAKRRAVLKIVGAALDRGGRIGGSPHDAAGFIAYYMAHDSHHRGQIVLSLKQAGHPVNKKVQYGIWEWGVR